MEHNWRHHHKGSSGCLPISQEKPGLPSPGSDVRFEDVFDFPCVENKESVDYLSQHGRIMFIVRGPAGTGKRTLSFIIAKKYPGSKIYSAVDYFSELFAPSKKNRETIKKAHDYCHEKAKTACDMNEHPIIIQNSNIQKWEMQFYIDLAIEYCYTVIMVTTTSKLDYTAEVLEKTNTQGLTKGYFENRLKQWVEVVPEYTGWVPSPADIAHLMTEAHNCMESLMQVKDFSKIFGATSGASPKDFFKPECFPFCLAAYCNEGADPSMKNYYLSKYVQQVYGKVFHLFIHGFVITSSLVAAVVHVDKDMQDFVLDNKGFVPQDAGGLSHVLGACSLNSGVKAKQPVTHFSRSSQKTVKFCAKKRSIHAKNVSFIVLLTAVNKLLSHPYIRNASEFSYKLFSSVTDSNGNLSADSFTVMHNNVKSCKLPNDSWLILLPEAMSLKSVFTGLYI